MSYTYVHRGEMPDYHNYHDDNWHNWHDWHDWEERREVFRKMDEDPLFRSLVYQHDTVVKKLHHKEEKIDKLRDKLREKRDYRPQNTTELNNLRLTLEQSRNETRILKKERDQLLRSQSAGRSPSWAALEDTRSNLLEAEQNLKGALSEFEKRGAEVLALKETRDQLQKEIAEPILHCKICLIDESNMLLEPCNHIGTCETCTSSLKVCPICRTPINSTRKVFVVT